MTSEDPDLRRLKWVAVLAPLLFLAVVELVRNLISPDFLNAWPGYLLLAGAVLVGTLFFAEAIFGVIRRMQARLARQNRELLALHDAGLAITSELELEPVLQRVVDQARELGGAHYGALSLLKEEGGIQSFLTSGISQEQRARIGPIPAGHGLLGAVIDQGEALRLADLTSDQRSYGFPPYHPPMRSLLAVPILSHGRILGSLYLTEKEAAPEFDEDDQHRLERFATQAAIAIENAHLHRQVWALAVTQERERIAREMHDSVAQVLGYVNTKAQAAQELMRAGQAERAEEQLQQLSQTAREAYAEVRENILGLRTSLDGGAGLVDTLGNYLPKWEEQSGVRVQLVTVLAEDSRLQLSALAELQLLRIIQEALANVRKHAAATEVRVEVRQAADRIQTTIADNGVGFDPQDVGRGEFPRFGLATMRERAESVDGSFMVQSSSGAGTLVSVMIPDSTGASASIGGQRAGTHR